MQYYTNKYYILRTTLISRANVIRMEEAVLANEKRLQEKMHECAQLGGELDRARDEAARALQRANERIETIRK